MTNLAQSINPTQYIQYINNKVEAGYSEQVIESLVYQYWVTDIMAKGEHVHNYFGAATRTISQHEVQQRGRQVASHLGIKVSGMIFQKHQQDKAARQAYTQMLSECGYADPVDYLLAQVPNA